MEASFALTGELKKQENSVKIGMRSNAFFEHRRGSGGRRGGVNGKYGDDDDDEEEEEEEADSRIQQTAVALRHTRQGPMETEKKVWKSVIEVNRKQRSLTGRNERKSRRAEENSVKEKRSK